MCGVMSIVNDLHDGSIFKNGDRLIPRTLDLPVYSVAAFNDKVNDEDERVACGGCARRISHCVLYVSQIFFSSKNRPRHRPWPDSFSKKCFIVRPVIAIVLTLVFLWSIFFNLRLDAMVP